MDGMDSQDTVLDVKGNTLNKTDILHILNQIGPSNSSRAAGGDDSRMTKLNKRELDTSSDSTKKQRASSTRQHDEFHADTRTGKLDRTNGQAE